MRRSRVFAGNASEAATLAERLEGLKAPPGAMVAMEAGIATAANVQWLVAQGYRYLVARRGGERQFRRRLKEQGISDSWTRLRRILSVQARITVSFRQVDARTLNIANPPKPSPNCSRSTAPRISIPDPEGPEN